MKESSKNPITTLKNSKLRNSPNKKKFSLKVNLNRDD